MLFLIRKSIITYPSWFLFLSLSLFFFFFFFFASKLSRVEFLFLTGGFVLHSFSSSSSFRYDEHRSEKGRTLVRVSSSSGAKRGANACCSSGDRARG